MTSCGTVINALSRGSNSSIRSLLCLMMSSAGVSPERTRLLSSAMTGLPHGEPDATSWSRALRPRFFSTS
jgi:hypothetical protein